MMLPRKREEDQEHPETSYGIILTRHAAGKELKMGGWTRIAARSMPGTRPSAGVEPLG